MIVMEFETYEATAPVYQCVLQDDQDPPVPIAVDALTELTLTLIQDYSKAVVNLRDAQDVLNANGVAVDADGLLSWQLDPDDTAILNPALRKEPHRAIFQWQWLRPDTSLGHGAHEVVIMVLNLDRVPTPA